MDRKFRSFMLAIVIVIFISYNLKLTAQVVQYMPLDVLSGIDQGTIQVIVSPPLSEDSIDKIFDGNPYTKAEVQNSDTLCITLQLNEAVKLFKSEVFFWNEGQWTLEIADSQEDLDQQSGSYQLLVSDQDCAFFVWDSATFSPVNAKFIQLIARNLQESNFYIGEWTINVSITLTSLMILPQPLKLIPFTSLQLEVDVVDESGNAYPYNFDEQVTWHSSNTSVASINEMGNIHAHSLGSALITATTTALSGTTTANVISDFESTNAETMILNVALVLQDPVIDSTNMRKIHQVCGWTDPMVYANQLVEEFYQISDGVVQFQIAEVHDDEGIFTRLEGELMTVDTLAYFYLTPGKLYGRDTPGTLQNLAEVQGKVRFDYNEMIDYYDLNSKRNSGVIDEIWVYAHPFAGMYESQLVGPGAFWWNSPPLDHPGLEKLLSIMGWNYERGLDCAIHSVGHRVESAIRHIYGRWDCENLDPNNWELFTRIDKDIPGQAHIGNIHFPPNGQSDYDYDNGSDVITYADNWKRYPILLDQTRTINCSEWGCTHLGYMRWWFSHLPRFTGVTDGVLNNWWHYFVDYEGAVEKANQITAIDIKDENMNILPSAYLLSQNYPNPFNLETTILYTIAKEGFVKIDIFNILGQNIHVLVNEYKQPGVYTAEWDGKNKYEQPVPSGIYFYQMKISNEKILRRKMLLLK